MGEAAQRGGYAPGLATRDAIIAAAMRMVAAHGFKGFSLRDLGREVGISHPAVIYHFPSKDTLATTVIKRFEDELGLFSVELDSASGRLNGCKVAAPDAAAWCGRIVELVNHPDVHLLMDFECMLMVEGATPDHPAHDHVLRRYEVARSFLAANIEQLAQRGRLRLSLTAKATAQSLIRNWQAFTIRSRYHGCEEGQVCKPPLVDFLAVALQLVDPPAEVLDDLLQQHEGPEKEVFSQVIAQVQEIRA